MNLEHVISPFLSHLGQQSPPPLVVQHKYHDHAHDKVPDYVSANMIVLPTSATSEPFPVRLLRVLDQVEADGFGHIVSWQPHGRCFVVRNSNEFKRILPRYFNQSKIASFQRQLNLYGFQRITQGMDKGGYYHEMFLRGKVFLAHQIIRTKVKGTKVRAKANPDEEPKFWSMEWIQPTQTAAVATSTTSSMVPHTLSKTVRRLSIVSTGSDDNNFTTSFPTLVTSSCAGANGGCEGFIVGEDDHDSTAEVICQWGKSFHALDVLPDDIESSMTMSPSTLFSMLLSASGEDDGNMSFMDDLFD